MILHISHRALSYIVWLSIRVSPAELNVRRLPSKTEQYFRCTKTHPTMEHNQRPLCELWGLRNGSETVAVPSPI